jgi:hypothetical protein
MFIRQITEGTSQMCVLYCFVLKHLRTKQKQQLKNESNFAFVNSICGMFG